MENKVKRIHSIGTKILILTVLMSLLSGLWMVWTYAPRVKSEMITTSDSYLNDLAKAYGSRIGEKIETSGLDEALSSAYLTDILAGIGIEGMDSSYIYVVDSQGTMLYHPTAEKIGQPVENSVVKGIVADIEAGRDVKNGVIAYEYKGAIKHAATYVNDGQDYILIVTVDEDNILKELGSINQQGWMGLALIVILCIVAASILIMLIVRPIKRLETTITSLAQMDFSENEVAASLAAKPDEIGMMALALGELRNELVAVVESIREKSEALEQAANALKSDALTTSNAMGQVDSAVGDIAGGASSQAEETQRASENVIMIGNMVETTSGEVSRVMETSNRMQTANDDARDILQQLTVINQKAEEYIEMIAKQTDETNASALQIGEATKIITEIAEQTNLLSLNASIEAARAGEQGKGFAVVASEIQKLAEQSTTSARQIEEILQTLLSDSERSVEIMEQVKKIIREQSEYMGRTDEAFDHMRQGVLDSIHGMQQIADRTKSLDDARVNVVDVVNNLTAIAEENAAATEETSASVIEVTDTVAGIAEKVQTLHDIAADLDEQIKIFQI